MLLRATAQAPSAQRATEAELFCSQRAARGWTGGCCAAERRTWPIIDFHRSAALGLPSRERSAQYQEMLQRMHLLKAEATPGVDPPGTQPTDSRHAGTSAPALVHIRARGCHPIGGIGSDRGSLRCAATQATTSCSPARQGSTAAGARRSADSSRRVLFPQWAQHSPSISTGQPFLPHRALEASACLWMPSPPSPCTHCAPPRTRKRKPSIPRAARSSQRAARSSAGCRPSQELLAVLCSELGDGAVPFVRPIEVRHDTHTCLARTARPHGCRAARAGQGWLLRSWLLTARHGAAWHGRSS
jgi:hypothetical protein